MAKDHKEIERAWILPNNPPQELINDSILHLISYIFINNYGEMRVVRRYAREKEFLLTLKTHGDMVRQEWEEEIQQWSYNILEQQAVCGLKKTRHFINYHDFLLEIDEYHYRFERGTINTEIDSDISFESKYEDIAGKIRLECEFSSEKEANDFILPGWAVGATEVTSDRRYKNAFIAKNGWPE